MVFASGIFLFLFLPATLTGYHLLRKKPIIWKNLFLLVMSLLFYLKGGIKELMVLANTMAVFADKAFDLLEAGELTTVFAWFGALAYTMQIYYDFSGYSDMAID